MLKRLRIKFICINMAIVTVMLGIVFGLVLHFTKSSLESESIRMMQAIAMDPLQLGRPNESSQEIRLPYFTLQIGYRGELVAVGGGYYDLSDEGFLNELIHLAFSSEAQTGVISEYNLRFCRIVTPSTQCLVFADISSERSTIRNLVQTCLLIAAVSLLAFFLISLLLARWAVKPVDRAWTQQRQFVADASHELKTPLTVIMTNAELLQTPGYDEPSRQQFAGSILTMSRQMRGLVEGLLELARVDTGAANTAFSRLDFSKLISDAVLPFEPIFFEKGMELFCQIDRDIWVRGSTQHLNQLLDILLDNAQKYASPQARVTLSLTRQSWAHCLLTVSNPGAEISPDDLKNIFKRFYRVDRARSMDHSYGLGLSIAERIVKSHHGKIWAESANGSNTFLVQLPIDHGRAGHEGSEILPQRRTPKKSID